MLSAAVSVPGRRLRVVFAMLLAASVLAVLPAAPVGAQPTLITNCLDVAGIVAQLEAGGDYEIDCGPGAVIELDATTIHISISDVQTTVIGNGVTFDANDFGRIFSVFGGSALLALTDVTLTGGNITVNSANTIVGGGAIRNFQGTLNLTDVTFRDNIVSSTGSNSIGRGAAIENAEGNVTIIGGSFGDNSAQARTVTGGVIFNSAGVINLTGTTFSSSLVAGTTSLTMAGGVISNMDGGVLTLTNTTVNDYNTGGITAVGGVIYSLGSSVTVVDSTLTNNLLLGLFFGTGGAIFSEDSDVSISNSTISGNRAVSGFIASGGAIVALGGTLDIGDSTFDGNTSRSSITGGFSLGGALNAVDTTATIARSTFSNNSATSGVPEAEDSEIVAASAARGLAPTSTSRSLGNTPMPLGTIEDSGVAAGGAVSTSGDGSLTISDSTFSGNTAHAASDDAETNATAEGGALLSDAGFASTIARTTFSGNTATATTSVSTAFTQGGAIVSYGPLSLLSTILAASSPGHCAEEDAGVITSLGYNLADDPANPTCFDGTIAGDQLVNDARIGPLQDNGGPTLTHMPDLDGPAIDQGNCAAIEATIDQRGLPRVVDLANVPNAGNGCDVGSVEFQGIATEGFQLRSGLEPYPGIVRRQAGDPIYVRFSLSAPYDGGSLAAVLVQQINCSSGQPIGSPQSAQTTGGLRYFAGADYYQLIWRTQSSWANTCRQLILQFTDGSEARFNVEFTRNR
jgi:hypothetical protein